MRDNFAAYLTDSDIIDFHHPLVKQLAQRLAAKSHSELELVKNCFEYVRDQTRHTGDYQDQITTLKASEVLKHQTGWCYAKSHLLAALLRANEIPAALCYQRLICAEDTPDSFCLHGLNAVYLSDYGWYRLDPRGNKASINAQFNPPQEQLAFTLSAKECDIPGLFAEPIAPVIHALTTQLSYAEMIQNFPDYQP